jgi:hypothetical protein
MYSVFEQFKIFTRLAAKCHFLFVPRMPNKKSFMLRDVRLQAVVHITTKMLKKTTKHTENIAVLRFMLHAAPPNSCFCEQFCWKVTCSQQRIARTFVIAWKNKVARGFLQPHDYCLSPPQREIFLNFLRYFVTGRPRKDRP